MPQRPTIIPMSDDAKPITPSDVAPTVLPDSFLNSEEALAAARFKLPSYKELPTVELYRDQVITYIEGVLSPLAACSDGAWLTPSMVNNYVKQRLVPAPAKKLYGREHIAHLLIICIFKQFLTIDAIGRLLAIQRMTYPVDVAYDYVAVEVNHAVSDAFDTTSTRHEDSASMVTRESVLVRSAAEAFAAKAFLMSYLAFSGYERTEANR